MKTGKIKFTIVLTVLLGNSVCVQAQQNPAVPLTPQCPPGEVWTKDGCKPENPPPSLTRSKPSGNSDPQGCPPGERRGPDGECHPITGEKK